MDEDMLDQGVGANDDLGYLYLFGDVDMAMAATAAEFILGAPKDQPLKVFISSHGGNPYAGWAVHDLMRSQARVKLVTSVALGAVESAAVIMYLGAHKRVAWPSARFMVHGTRGGASSAGQVAFREAEDNMRTLDYSMAALLDEACSGHLTLLQWRAMMLDARMHTWSACEAYGLGLVTQLDEWSSLDLAPLKR